MTTTPFKARTRTLLIASAAVISLGLGTVRADEVKSADVVKIDVPRCANPAKKILIGTVTCRASTCRTGTTAQGAGAGIGALAMLIAQQQGVGQLAINGEGLSASLADMLSSSLRETGCFDITDKEGVEEVKRQMEALGKTFQGEEVDLIISGSISSVGVVRGSRQILMVRSYSTTSNLTFDAKVIDARTAKIVGGGTYSGRSERSSSGVDVGVVRTGSNEGIAGSPLEDVAREAIIRATSDIVGKFAKDNVTATTIVEVAPSAN